MDATRATLMSSLGLAAGLAWANNAAGITGDNPYQAIVTRNVFGLKDPPPAVVAPVTPPKGPSNLKITGITTSFGVKRAHFVANEPGKTPPVRYLTLAEGVEQDGLRVVSVNDQTGSVTVIMPDTKQEVVMTFQDDGIKPPVGATPAPGAAMAGVPRPPGVGAPPAQPVPGMPNPGFAVPAVPGNIPRVIPGSPPSTMAAVPMEVQAVAAMVPNAAMPTRSLRASSQPDISLEQQILMMEVNRELNRNNPRLPPLPPTALTPVTPAEPTLPAGVSVIIR